MPEILTQPTQDYLKMIYELCEAHGSASTTALAERLGVAPASVTGMIQRLAGGTPALVIYRKHQGVTLTYDGQRAALEVIRHHRLIETYLVETLGYSWDAVHAEADRLEHVISEEFEARIAAILGNPTRDPHGELIPTVDLVMPQDVTLLLSDLRPPQKAIIVRVCAKDPALLRHLESLSLTPGRQVTATGFSPFDKNLELIINDGPVKVVGNSISSQIFIDIL
jgi:DtxR family Mn-dependent transcriptional regulator